jgi:hypothetical protein
MGAAYWKRIFDYRGLYNYIVDFFEDVQDGPAKKRAQDLLKWWSL